MTILQAQTEKANLHLNSLINWQGNIVKRRERIEALIKEGRRPLIDNIPDYNAISKAEKRLEQINKRYILGLSNENIPEVKEGLEIQEKLKNKSYTKPEYLLSNGELEAVITKTEYDYAIQLIKGEQQCN